MTTITKERLQWLANISGRDDIDDIDGGEIRELALIALASLEAVPDGLVKAVRFYEQVKHENPPVETGAWKDAVDWVLEEACQAVNIRIKGE